jgi:hypothetical protein
MKFEIKHKLTGAILFSIETESLKLAVEAAIKYRANLIGANLINANLINANLTRANLTRADLTRANLYGANLYCANLIDANLTRANLYGANLYCANLIDANLYEANLYGANLIGANLIAANLTRANLTDAKGLVKLMGVERGNVYWKRFEKGLNNRGYQYRIGLNILRKDEVFATDERVMCSHPGFHFSSRTWAAVNYPDRPLEARIRIPDDAKINEPWATDGKASADKIEILQIFDVATGNDVTEEYR